MRDNITQAEYARMVACELADIERHQANIADLKASAKDAGLNVRAIGKAAKELRMDSDKRAKKYDDEDQLDLLRDALGLTATPMRIAAE